MTAQTLSRLVEVPSAASLLPRLLIAVTLLWLLAGAVALIAGRGSASLRHRVWALATAAVLGAPVLMALLPQWRLALLPAAGQSLATHTVPVAPRRQDPSAQVQPSLREMSVPADELAKKPPHSVDLAAMAAPDSESSVSRESAAAPPGSADRWPAVMFGAWAFVAGLLVVRQCVSVIGAAALANRAMPVDGCAAELTLRQLASEFGVRQPRLRTHPRIPTAMCVGLFRPTVLLPGDHLEWDDGRLRATLAHELAHATRRDVAWQSLARLACCAYWLHPMAWLAAWRMREEREVACDDWVLRAGHRPAEYARLLVSLAESLAERRLITMGGAVTILSGRDLRRRLSAVLEARRSRLPISRRGSKALSVVTVGIVLAVAVLRPVAAVQNGSKAPAGMAPATQPARSIAGRVMGPNGNPVAGATVWHVVRKPGLVQAVVGRSQTDSEGNFRIALAPGLTEEYTTVLVRAEGLGMGGQTLRAGDPAQVVLSPPATIRVTVLGPDRAPLGGCRITPSYLVGSRTDSYWSLPLPPEVGQGLSATTDAQGVCEIGGLPRNAKAWLEAEDARFARCDFSDALGTGADGRVASGTLRLQAASSISGSVKFPDGRPVAGVQIVAQPITGQNVASGGAVTDARGEYHVRQLKAATFNVAALLEGQLERDWTAAALQEVRVAPGQGVRDANLMLVRGGLLTGRVLKGDTSEPVPHVEVGLQGPSRPRTSAMIQATHTDDKGRYTFRVPAGAQYVYFPDRPPEGYLRPGPEGQEPTVRDGQTVEVDIKLPRDPNPALEGRVVTADGRPAAGAAVGAELPDDHPLEYPRATKAGPDGHFRLVGIPAGARLRARLDHQATTQPAVVGGGETDLVLKLSKVEMALARVLVTDPTGEPVPDAKVDLSLWRRGFGRGLETARTDREGRCTFAELSPGERYSVTAEADGYGRNSASFQVDFGAQIIEMKPLKLARADQEISGHLVDPNGKGVAGVPVEINGPQTGNHTATTDRDGTFRFGVVSGARALVYLRGHDGNPLPAEQARSGDTGVKLRFEPRKAATQPATVPAQPDNRSAERVFRASLERTLPELRPGTYTVAEVFEYLSDISGIKIETDWEGLAAAGVRSDARITLQWKAVKFPEAMSAILDKAAKPGVLTWQISDRQVLIRARTVPASQPATAPAAPTDRTVTGRVPD